VKIECLVVQLQSLNFFQALEVLAKSLLSAGCTYLCLVGTSMGHAFLQGDVQVSVGCSGHHLFELFMTEEPF